jgi:heptose-I-phosphate ethanolaminephosphotransferase
MQESIEFIDLKETFAFLILAPYTFLFLYLLKHKPAYSKSKNQYIIITFIIILSVGFISENAIKRRLIRKGIPTITKVNFSFIEEIKLYQEVLKEKHPEKVNAQLIDKSNNQTVILVIGESTNRNHLSLYGSKRKTTPRLDKRSDITVF